MQDKATSLVQSISGDERLRAFVQRLRAWLLDQTPDFPESRAKALLRAAEAVDEATLTAFSRLVSEPQAARVALYDLLHSSELAGKEEVAALAGVSAAADAGDEDHDAPWLSLALAAYARQKGYAVEQFDPASPPERYTPAGQSVARACQFLRRQVQRSVAERERLAERLAWRRQQASSGSETIAPLPPHFRPPVPVRYAEVARETVQVDPEEQSPQEPISRGEPIVISEDDVADTSEASTEAATDRALRMPPIRISREQLEGAAPPSPLPPSGVVVPSSSGDSRPSLTMALRQMFRTEELETTKLRVVVQEFPDGPGLYGLQVKVTCKGIKSHVAGTTDREGRFLAELPVRQQEGLTYDVDVTWPRESGGETERKSITLHRDRTEFTLPFYRRLQPEN